MAESNTKPTPKPETKPAQAKVAAPSATSKKTPQKSASAEKKSTPPTPKAKSKEAKTKPPKEILTLNQRLEKLKLPTVMRRHLLFYVICGLSLYINIWMYANSWQLSKAGENENWFHEVLTTVFLISWCVLAYFKIYRKSTVYRTMIEQREAEAKAAKAAKARLEEEKKKKTFLKIIADFQSAQTYESKSMALTKILTVGLESPSLRQKVVDLLNDLNKWIPENKPFMAIQSLVKWRLKGDLFEISDRFQVDTSTQDLSVKAINILEAIVKKHLVDFHEGKATEALDLTGKVIPTLSLGSLSIPAGSVVFEDTVLWQSTFSECTIDRITFQGADLEGSSFWRARFIEVDMEKANLKNSKLRTDVQKIKHLTPEQFFGTKEWELCFISRDQFQSFFGEYAEGDTRLDEWNSAKIRREKLYFNFQQI